MKSEAFQIKDIATQKRFIEYCRKEKAQILRNARREMEDIFSIPLSLSDRMMLKKEYDRILEGLEKLEEPEYHQIVKPDKEAGTLVLSKLLGYELGYRIALGYSARKIDEITRKEIQKRSSRFS